MAQEKRELPRWYRTQCDYCNHDFLATRTEPRVIKANELLLCTGCEVEERTHKSFNEKLKEAFDRGYEAGYNDGESTAMGRPFDKSVNPYEK